MIMKFSGLGTIALAVSVAFCAQSVSAKVPLKDVSYVSEGLIAAGMAIEIDTYCDDLSVRLFRGLNFLNGLKQHARDLGYTEDEIDAYINDSAEKSRLEDVARGRLADLGAVVGQNDTYCVVGRGQIAAKTTLGSLLR